MQQIVLALILMIFSSCNESFSLDDGSDNNREYVCDGREYCSQMSSCEEATFFINNCPNTKMDGNYDGVPCESQWCN